MADHDSGKINLDLSVWTAALTALGVAAMAMAFEFGGDLAHATAATPRRAHSADVEAHPLRLTILHTNDMHGQVHARGAQGGLVALGRRIRAARDAARQAGDAVLLLDAGDVFKGTPEGDLTDGRVVVEWMNHLGYDAASVGNHEFDHGLEVVERLAEAAEFPLLAANLREEESGACPAWLGRGTEGPLRGAAIVRTLRDGWGRTLKVGVVGTTPADLAQVTLSGLTAGLKASDEVEALKPVLDALPDDLDLVVLVSHSGIERDSRVAEQLPGRVHVVVGGHDHKTLPEGQRVGSTLLTQTGCKTEFLGRVRVEFGVEGPSASAELLPPGDDLEALLAPHVEAVEREFAEVVGNLSGPLKRSTGFRSSMLGNLQADLMREHALADVAFQNKPGIRADLDAGPVTKREIYEVAPFGNHVVSMKLSGAQLWRLLEQFLSDERTTCDVSGLHVSFTANKPAGERLVEVLVQGKPIQAAVTYTVATNQFLAEGGDGKTVFTEGVERVVHPETLRELLEARLSRSETYTSPSRLAQRLTRVD